MQKKIKVVLIDDDKHALEYVSLLIKEFFDELEILAQFQSPVEALKAVVTLNPDLIFLDVEMTAMNGLDVLQLLPKEIESKVVMITGKSDYAIEAFRNRAFDYLVKPISRETLDECVERYKKSTALIQRAELNDFLIINRHDKAIFLNKKDIVMLEADGPYTLISSLQEAAIASSKSLGYYELLLDPVLFYKVHRSVIINLNHILEVVKESNGDGVIIMSNKTKIKIGRIKKYEFLRKFT